MRVQISDKWSDTLTVERELAEGKLSDASAKTIASWYGSLTDHHGLLLHQFAIGESVDSIALSYDVMAVSDEFRRHWDSGSERDLRALHGLSEWVRQLHHADAERRQAEFQRLTGGRTVRSTV